jgi:hypothetical protein
MRKLGLLLTAVIMAATGSVAVSGPASASHTSGACPGTYVGQLQLWDVTYNNDGVIAFVNLYKYGSGNDDRCARLVKVSEHQGSTHSMWIVMVRTTEFPGQDLDLARNILFNSCHQTLRCDDGSYNVYAGPVKHLNINGGCVSILAGIYYPNTAYPPSENFWNGVACY